MSAKITYNGKTTELADGYKATLPCKDYKMASDVVIESEGEVIPEISEVDDFRVSVEALEGELEISYSVSEKVALPSGHNRLASVSDDNFIASNIKNSVNIFGLTGAYEGTNSPLPTEVSTEAEMTALLTSGEIGGVYKYTGTTGTYENGALYVLEEEAVTNNGSHILNASNNEKIDITQYIDQEWRQLNGVSLAGDLGTTYTISSTSSSGKVIISIGGSYTSYIGNPSGSDCVGMETIVQGEYHCLVDMFGPA